MKIVNLPVELIFSNFQVNRLNFVRISFETYRVWQCCVGSPPFLAECQIVMGGGGGRGKGDILFDAITFQTRYDVWFGSLWHHSNLTSVYLTLRKLPGHVVNESLVDTAPKIEWPESRWECVGGVGGLGLGAGSWGWSRLRRDFMAGKNEV